MIGDLEDDIDYDVLVDELSTPPTQEAAAELALSAKRLERTAEALIRGLTPAERAILDRRFAQGPLSKADQKAMRDRSEALIKRLKQKGPRRRSK